MLKAFVFGKFLPFHRGHEALIRFALQHCDHLTVLVCASDQETLPGTLRQGWIEQTFANQTGLTVQLLPYRESQLPNTSESSEAVAQVWADYFRLLLPDCSLVVTSEAYGALVAAHLGIRHLAFDMAREQVPVSASLIRADLRTYWKFLPASVKPFYARKVVLLGAESTGKTTLATRLAARFGATLVAEAGRDLIVDSANFTTADLNQVAAKHARRINHAQTGASPLLILDTDVHITQSYAHFSWGEELLLAPEIYSLNRADLYLYLVADVPFVQDGTRLPVEQQQRLDQSHRQTLRRYNISVVEIHGTWAQRFAQAVSYVNTLLGADPPDDRFKAGLIWRNPYEGLFRDSSPTVNHAE